MTVLEAIQKIKGLLVIVQDKTASNYVRFKAGIQIIAVISELLPDSLPFGQGLPVMAGTASGAQSADAMIAEIERHCQNPVAMGADPTGKIGDGTLIKLFAELVKTLGPIIIPLIL